MICRECIDRLLVADTGTIARALRSPAGSGVDSTGAWVHLSTCRECRDAAERILAGEARLRAELTGLLPDGSTSEAARRARVESGRRRARTRVRAGWALAAAALAGVLGVRAARVAEDSPSSVSTLAYGATAPALPEVETALDESVMVFETADESVVVFWFYEGRGE